MDKELYPEIIESKRIVAYQLEKDLRRWADKLRDDPSAEVTEYRSRYPHRVIYKIQNPLTKQDVILYHVTYYPCKAGTIEEAYTVAGLQVDGIDYLEGMYSHEILTYLSTRLRG